MMPSLKVTEDHTQEFLDLINSFKNDSVLIGIPAADKTRDDSSDDPEPINNATILFINEFGSPANNIPARPVMTIGIFKAADAIADEFKKAAQNAFSKCLDSIWTYYERAGIIASNSVKRVITTNESIVPPAESTLAARKSKGFKGTKALLVTGQMRNAITYVVKRKL